MSKYRILEEFNLNGIIQKKDAIVELDYQRANLKSIQGKLEKVPDTYTTPDNSVLGSVVPGTPLTPEQKEKLAKENAAETAEANRLAAEHRARDLAEGKGEPAVKVVAESLKDKLVNEEFENKNNPPSADNLPPETDPNQLP